MIDAAQTAILYGKLLVDGNGGTPISHGAVRIGGSRIETVGPAEVCGSRTGTEWDFRSYTIIPGLIDVHTHLTLAGDGRSYEGHGFGSGRADGAGRGAEPPAAPPSRRDHTTRQRRA